MAGPREPLRRAAVERRRAYSRRGITANVAARRRRTRIRWAIGGGVAALLVAGTVVWFTTRDDGGIPHVALSGKEVDADGALGITAPDPQWGKYFQARVLSSYDGTQSGRFRYAEPFSRL